MKVLVVGMGSIGCRHIDVLNTMGCEVFIVSRRASSDENIYSSLAVAFDQHKFEYVVIATETDEHIESLRYLSKINFKGPVLVEKPVFSTMPLKPFEKTDNIFVAYNLRFHPALQALKQQLEGQDILTASIYVGQYLPTWRSGDHQKSYSASKAKGGGVLRDLSHELDYVTWLLGKPSAVCAKGGRYSDLTVDSDDVYGVLMETKHCPLVMVQMNYFDRVPRRNIVVNTTTNTYSIDLIKHNFNIAETYRLEHEAVLAGDLSIVSSYVEGLNVLKLINAIEASNDKKSWVNV